MKCLTKNFAVAAIVCFTVLATTSLFAQEWSAAQKEVWKNVETYNDLWAKRDHSCAKAK